MSRNSAGTYTLPQPAFISGTTISSSAVNSNFSDIATALTGSLSRAGDGGMLAHWRGIDGTKAAPAYSFTDDQGVGFYRANTSDVRFAAAGADILKMSTTALTLYKATTIDAGGLTITAGGLTVTAGGATIAAGGLSSVGTTPAQGGVAGANTLEASGALSTTSGHSHALTTLAKTATAGPNTIRLNARTENSGAVTGWQQVRVGLSYDVDGVVGSGGGLYFGSAGARLAGGTAATATDPTNALELTNGHLKLSGTAPNADEAVANTLTSSNLIKAWGSVSTDGGGNASMNGGCNLASAVVTTGGTTTTVRLTFASAMASAVYAVLLTGQRTGTVGRVFTVAAQTATTVDVNCTSLSDGSNSSTDLLNNTAVTFYVMVLGLQ
jgi:hypothetical protein